jgi:hypothetical protein
MRKTAAKKLDFSDFSLQAFDPDAHCEVVHRAVYSKPTRCLRYRESFVSEDVRYNRVCGGCRSLPSWSDGVAECSLVTAF